MVEEAMSGGGRTRHEARVHVDELLSVPFDPEDAAEWQSDLWAKKNVAAAQRAGLFRDDDPHMVGEIHDPHMVGEIPDPVGA